MFILTLIIVSVVATFYLANKVGISRSIYLSIMNIVLPFSGLIVTLYIIYFVIPKKIAEAQGLPLPPSPLQPLYDKISPHIKPHIMRLREKLGLERPKDENGNEKQKKHLID